MVLEAISITHQKEIGQLAMKIREIKNYNHKQLENQKENYVKEIQKNQELHKGLIEELKNSHLNERNILEKRIISLEQQIREVIQSIVLTENNQNLKRNNNENLESIADERESEFESNYTRSQLLKSSDLQDNWKFNTSKIYEQNYELKEKLELLLERIIPEKDTCTEDLKKELKVKNLQITDLKHQLGKAHHMLGNLRANVQDLKQRAKVLEDFLGEHTNKSWESYTDENQILRKSRCTSNKNRSNLKEQEREYEEIK